MVETKPKKLKKANYLNLDLIKQYMIDDMIRMVQKLKKDMESNIPIIEGEIDSIIENREESPKRIERILDTLLDYLQIGVGKDQFVKLNSYYGSICPRYSAEYEKFYYEIIDE